VVTRAHHPESRDPVDLDYLVLGPRWDPGAVEHEVRAIVARPSPDGIALATAPLRFVPIWEETTFPGLRVIVPATMGEEEDELQIDFGYGDPLAVPNERIVFHGVGPLSAVARETMIAWKIHGLVEWGRGRWRPKDLHDLDVLLSRPADEHGVRAALEVAFTSRGTELAALAGLLFRPAWGESTGRRKLWKKLALTVRGEADFARARARVRALLARIGLEHELAPHRDAVLAEEETRAQRAREGREG